MTSEDILIRNFSLMKRVCDNLEILTTVYKLSQRDINVVQTLLFRHNSFKPYITAKIADFSLSRRTAYRAIDSLENQNIITVVNRPKNQYDCLQVYFTVTFIEKVCGIEQAELYTKWFNWQKEKQKGD